MAVPEPELLEHSQIFYTWFMQQPEHGEGHFASENSTNLINAFWADYPGDYQIRYIVTYRPGEPDATSAESEPITIHVRPSLTITQPPHPVDGYKYCYNSALISELRVDCAASAIPPTANDEIAWAMDEIPYSYLQNGPNDLDGPSITIIFRFLPVVNSSFGAKTVTARLNQWNIEVSKVINVFFPIDGRHFPGDPDPAHPTPNWFYLWRDGEVAHSQMISFHYDRFERWGAGGWYDVNFDSLWLTFASSDEYPDRTFGGITIPYKCGVDRTAHVIEHELHHKEIADNWREPNGKWYIESGKIRHPMFDPLLPRNPMDTDSDGLPNEYELQFSLYYGLSPPLNPDNADTYRYGNLTDGDQEVYCEIMARNFFGHAERDWSHGQFSKQWPQ